MDERNELERKLDEALGTLASVREVLARFSWGEDDTQYALEQIDQIVNPPAPEPEPYRPAGALGYILDGDFPQ